MISSSLCAAVSSSIFSTTANSRARRFNAVFVRDCDTINHVDYFQGTAPGSGDYFKANFIPLEKGLDFTVDERITFGRDVANLDVLGLQGSWVMLGIAKKDKSGDIIVGRLSDGQCQLLSATHIDIIAGLCNRKFTDVHVMSVNVHNGTAASFSVWDLKNAKSTKVGFSAMGNLATEHSPQGKLQHMTEVGTVYSFQPDVHAHQVVSGGDCLRLSLLPCMQPPLRILLRLRGGGLVPRTCNGSPEALARKARQLAISQRDQRVRQMICASS